MPATAVLDILSGLPNPQWVLTPDVAKQICDFILSAQPLKDVQPEAIPGLGYRGLLVDLPDCQAVDSTLRVFNGLVEIGGTFFSGPVITTLSGCCWSPRVKPSMTP